MSFDNAWEEQIYSNNLHINRYPYGELVSAFFNSLKFLPKTKLENKKEIKILELGCGSGNNLSFIHEAGFDAFGVDGSASACSIAKENIHENIKIAHAYFDDLPFGDNSIDIVIDRESTYCGTLEDIKTWWSEANRVLKKGGIVIAFMFSDEHPDLEKIQNATIQAKKIENNTYTDIQEGAFSGTGTAHFTSYQEIFDIFSFCEIMSINKHESRIVYNNSNSKFNYSEWIIVGVKK